MKAFAIIIVLFLFSQNSYSQTLIGIKQGFNMSKINYAPGFDQRNIKIEYINGYNGGLMIQYFGEPYLGLQAEILYSQKGFRTEYDTLKDTQYQRNIDYISVPLLTHFYFSKKKFSLFLLLGVHAGFVINSSETFKNSTTETTIDYEINKERDQAGEYGLTGGLGFKRKFSFGTIQFDAQYIYSFSSLYKWGYSNEDPDFQEYFIIPEQAQNQVISFNVAWLFPIKPEAE